ncbi:sensor histidine kinase [Streptomyces sp. NBC_00237]|uniref:sensor histidine kinase n=1 Tax=Streptomyces sp. NBC_00237 TaxID=2975687 RepID=UPI002259B3C8|nr:sensor histidine kinase [Streptomyces sp. NBC_00237]MCX5204422.1 sensor histidine kinase [Streptomyces sp. NBC_00237]
MKEESAGETFAPIGRPADNRRPVVAKLLWIGIWLAFMGAPVSDLLGDAHTAPAVVGGWLGLAAFVAVYFALVFRHTSKALARRLVWTALGTLYVLSSVLSLTLGRPWLTLFVYVSVACGACLPMRAARWAIPAVTATLLLAGLGHEGPGQILGAVAIPALLGGFAMTGVRQLVRTTVELREARATVAQLAANEERLRLARDLHDLLGHSLSLITLKSELAGRMLPGHPEQAAQQVADIEKVSRQALVDVREAVTGYRRATLAAELAGARTALAAAGVAADLPAALPPDAPDVPPEQEEALAWALREAVTNVVRHSGARRCTVRLRRTQTLDGAFLELTVEDDGRGTPGTPRAGNGLTGMGERLARAGGTVHAAPALPGFALRATVPLPTVPA